MQSDIITQNWQLPTKQNDTNTTNKFTPSPIVKSLDGRLKISEFKSQLHYCAYFQNNTLGKGINSLIPPQAEG